jgi:hypothetical protein
MTRTKLFFIEGIRHSAVVLAADEREAIKLATEAHGSEKKDPRVLFGSVGDWETFGDKSAIELRLPKGYTITKNDKAKKSN